MKTATTGCRCGGRFTLVELLVALMIATIVIGMAVGITARITTGESVNVAVGSFSRFLYLCRQQAIMERERVALLVPHAGDLDTDGDGIEDRVEAGEKSTWGRAFRPCVVDTSGAFVRWIGGDGRQGPQSRWEYLPDGVFFCAVDTSSAGVAKGGLVTVTDIDIDEDGTPESGCNATALIYRSNGSTTGTNNVELLIGRGSVEDPTGDGRPDLVVLDFRDTDADDPAVPSGAPDPEPWKPSGVTAPSWRVVAGVARVEMLSVNWLTGKSDFELREYW